MIISSFASLLTILVTLVLVLALPVAACWLVFKVVAALCWLVWRGTKGIATGIGYGFRGIGMSLGHVFTFVRSTILDTLRLAGALLTSVFMIPSILGSVFLGRWSAANHYGRAFEREFKEIWVRLYRVLCGNPARFLGLRALTEGVEERLPDVMARAPGADHPRGGHVRFPGYTVTGSLPRGGSGARLYLAEPSPAKHDAFAKNGLVCAGQVVIKAFFLEDGSTLPQIVRESRALTAAKELGLVLDHSLEGESFWYVMPYVQGIDLAETTRDLHQRAGGEGLGEAGLRTAMGHAGQLLATLDRFHGAGLWHKDIKPANVIVSPDGYAHLVDFGLVTPLRSAMTLTTHGTEYFRDPEMVRLAMKGVKVHEVDGVKFDLYSIGAVLFSTIENSFPAHGSLSRLSKRCPEALRWIVRRAMADTKSRYGSAREMLADLAVVLEARDPFALKPADLPSFSGHFELADVDLDRFSPMAAGDIESLGKGSLRADPLRDDPLPAVGRPIRRRLQRGVVAASGLFFGALALGAVIVREQASDHLGHARARWADATEDAQFQSARAAVSQARSRAAETCYRHEDHVHHAANCSGHGALAVAERRSPSEPFDVLVVDDLPSTARPAALDAVARALRDAEMVPHGLSADDAQEIEWLAGARRAAGIGFPSERDARERVERYLLEDEVLEAVLWIGSSEEGQVIHRLIAPHDETVDERIELVLR